MTETSRAIQNCRLPRDPSGRAFGFPRSPLEVLVVDEDEKPVPHNTPGELLVRCEGKNPRYGFFSGYLKQPEETEKVWRNGWFHTGDIFKEKNSLLVEDLMTDGKSKINFVENIRSHGIECNLSLVVFKYNIFKEADVSIKRNNIKVYHLTDWEEVYNQMRLMNTFEASILLEIRKFLDDPVSWSNYKNQITKS